MVQHSTLVTHELLSGPNRLSTRFLLCSGPGRGAPVTGQGRHSGSPVLNVALVTRRRITSHPRSLVLKNGARVAGDVRPGGVWWRLVDAISIPSGVSWVGDRLASVEGPLVGLLPERGDAGGCGLGGWHSMSLRLFSLPRVRPVRSVLHVRPGTPHVLRGGGGRAQATLLPMTRPWTSHSVPPTGF